MIDTKQFEAAFEAMLRNVETPTELIQVMNDFGLKMAAMMCALQDSRGLDVNNEITFACDLGGRELHVIYHLPGDRPSLAKLSELQMAEATQTQQVEAESIDIPDGVTVH